MFLPTVKFAVDKSISDTFLLPNSAYSPLFSFRFMLGTPNAKVVVVSVVGTAPLHTPAMVATGPTVIESPSVATLVILLNLSVASSGN
jgi:hypothetical protein